MLKYTGAFLVAWLLGMQVDSKNLSEIIVQPALGPWMPNNTDGSSVRQDARLQPKSNATLLTILGNIFIWVERFVSLDSMINGKYKVANHRDQSC